MLRGILCILRDRKKERKDNAFHTENHWEEIWLILKIITVILGGGKNEPAYIVDKREISVI